MNAVAGLRAKHEVVVASGSKVGWDPFAVSSASMSVVSVGPVELAEARRLEGRRITKSSCCPGGGRGCGGGGRGEVKDRGGRGEERRAESGIQASGHHGGGRRWVGGGLVSAGVALTGYRYS